MMPIDEHFVHCKALYLYLITVNVRDTYNFQRRSQ